MVLTLTAFSATSLLDTFGSFYFFRFNRCIKNTIVYRFYSSHLFIQFFTAVFFHALDVYAQVGTIVRHIHAPRGMLSLSNSVFMYQTITSLILSLVGLALCWNVPYSLLQQVGFFKHKLKLKVFTMRVSTEPC